MLYFYRQIAYWQLRYHWSWGTVDVCFDVYEL
jgi:hypothetical protein